MPVIRAQVVFQDTNNLPEDQYVNVLHFFTPFELTNDVADSIQTQIRQFFNDPVGVPNFAVCSRMGGRVSRGSLGVGLNLYDLSEPEPRPVVERPWTLQAGALLDNLPSEVAACVSFYGARNIPRQRGRIYVGPLSTNALNAATGRMDDAFRTVLAEAAGRLAANNDPFAQWGVYSRANDPNEDGSEDAFTVIENGWVDNAFDTQRRRGLAASGRVVFTD